MDNYLVSNSEEEGYQRITAKTLIISVDTDVLFPQESQSTLFDSIKKYNAETTLITHCSPYGHDAFFKDEVIGDHLKSFITATLVAKNKKGNNNGILSTIGNTPLVNLTNIKSLHNLSFNIYAKLEAFNPGGSIKDRPAKAILLDAWEKGLINKNTTILEYSSGNMGIGLSQVCCYLGLKFICVIDPKTTQKTQQIMEAYGTRIICVEQPDKVTNEFLPAAIQRIKQLLITIPHAYWINQHGNPANVKAHWHTFKEIHNVLKNVDYLFCATSTCGTITGC